MNSPGACRYMAGRCLTAALALATEGDDVEAVAYDGAALGFAFRADELEYDARGGMTLRQAIVRAADRLGRNEYAEPYVNIATTFDDAALLPPDPINPVDPAPRLTEIVTLDEHFAPRIVPDEEVAARGALAILIHEALDSGGLTIVRADLSGETDVHGTTWDEPQGGEDGS